MRKSLTKHSTYTFIPPQTDLRKRKHYTEHIINVINNDRDKVDSTKPDELQTLTKVMFVRLAITSVVLFYLAISSLML